MNVARNSAWSALLAGLLWSSTVTAGQSGEALWSKGLVLLGSGDPRGAIALFDRAIAADPAALRAHFYRGMARRDVADVEGAIVDLRVVAQSEDSSDPVVARAALELARTLLDDGRAAEARPWLDEAEAHEATRVEARQLAAHRAGEGARAQSRLSLRAATRLEYDSNVVLAPRDSSLNGLYGIDGEDDGRTVLEAAASYALVRTERFDVVGSYSAEQSLHFTVDDSDVQRHRAALATSAFYERASFGALGRYDFHLVGDESFLSEVFVNPWLRVREWRGAELAFSYGLRRGYFHEDPFDDLSDGITHSFEALQSFDLGRMGSRVTGGYRFERRETDNGPGAAYEYDAHIAGLGLTWVLPKGFSADAAYAFRNADYDSESLGRNDDEHRLFFGLTRQLNTVFWVRLSQQSRFHDSNQASYEYRRHVTSISLEARY